MTRAVSESTVRHHLLSAAASAEALGVEPAIGLSSAEVAHRRALHGANELAEAPRVPWWRRLAHQFTDTLILILIGAAVVSFAVSGELKTPVVVLVVVVFNAVIGFVQENRAEASLDALRDLLVVEVRVRRDGTWRTVASEELVPGDVIALEAGDRVPADARLVHGVQLEVEEAALTGESVPAPKQTDALDDPELGLGDRSNLLFMNTTVTRGRGEALVTATGMDTEIGHIAGMLSSTGVETTPLQRQLDGLARSLARLALLIVAAVIGIGLLRGESLSDMLLTAVALAVASIPEGLPAVTAVTLAIGVAQMAEHHAIVKRLASVETLGCTTVICSDKTGTLTLNQMTAAELVVAGEHLAVEGTGYSPTGSIADGGGVVEPWLDDVLSAMALCNDASLHRSDDGTWMVVGDPTEGALVTLAAKGGRDVARLRATWPRIDEIPFDASHRFMATLHEVPSDEQGRDSVGGPLWLAVKGAPDALLDRSAAVAGPHGRLDPVDDVRGVVEQHNERIARQGMRVMAVAWKRLDAGDRGPFDHPDPAAAVAAVQGLTFGGLVAIVDPARAEARDAIAEAHRAGIRVTMITGDHAVTAQAIGADLGLGSAGQVRALTGAELDRMSDDDLAEQLDDVSVFARVSPEHKLRLVRALQSRGEVVAMTGDGVNDAPALRQADMGVAMGITGTEVSKDAATMVLADDNFATIVEAVRRGRTIYDNIVKFVRFQLSTTLGFAAIFLVASALGIAGGQPFTAIAILWVNIIMDGPPAMALGLDRGDEGIMDRSPRPRDQRILTRERWIAVGLAAATMAVGTLAVIELAPGPSAAAGTATVAGTMGFTTFVLFQAFNIMNVRSERDSIAGPLTFTNWRLWSAVGVVLALQVGVTVVEPLRSLFDLTSLELRQWVACVAVASTVVAVEEVRKAVLRRRTPTDQRPRTDSLVGTR